MTQALMGVESRVTKAINRAGNMQAVLNKKKTDTTIVFLHVCHTLKSLIHKINSCKNHPDMIFFWYASIFHNSINSTRFIDQSTRATLTLSVLPYKKLNVSTI